MKLGLGLYRHQLDEDHFRFARQCGATHLVVHWVDYLKGGGSANIRSDQPSGSALRMHPQLPLIYAADRSTGLVTVIRYNSAGAMSRLISFPANGYGPRDFELVTNLWLVTACMDSNCVCSIPLDSETGLPSGQAPSIAQIGTPNSICKLYEN